MNSNPVSKVVSLIISVIFLSSSPVFSREDLRAVGADQDNWQPIAASITDSISVDLNKITFGEALEIIAGKGDFKLSYNRSRLPLDQTVAPIRTSAPAFEVLFVLLQQTGTSLILTPDGELAIMPSNTSFDNDATISGIVLDAETKEPLIGTNISVLGTYTGCVSDSSGHFTLSNLPEGFLIIQFGYIGYKTRKVVTYAANNPASPGLSIEMESQQILLQEITITPGLFSIMGKGPTMRQILTHEDMQNITFGEDVYRALIRLPGVGANDFSAKFTVRGGENEEILVLLDGVEIYEPFHLKDVAGGAFSFLDVGVIEGVDLLTGGFPAEYGNRMSGVLTMKTIRPPAGSNQTSLGLSMMNAFFRSSGTFNGSQGAWFLSARRGFLDVLLAMVDVDVTDIPRPEYYDLHGKLDYQLDRKRQFSVHFLHAADHSDYIDYDDYRGYERKIGETDFGNTYIWTNFRTNPLPNLLSQTVLSMGRLTRHREAEELNSDGTESFGMLDHRDARVLGLRQSWDVSYSENWHIKGGFSIQQHESDYRFDLHDVEEDQINSDSMEVWERFVNTTLSPVGSSFGTYFSNRIKILDSLVVEIGVRYDAIGYNQSRRWSPRFNLVWTPAEQTFIRAGWGHFYQNDGIHEIRVEDGEESFLPPEMAKHWVAGLEHTYNNGVNFRLEGYYKKISQLHPDYRNGSNHIQFPELEGDRYYLNLNRAIYKGLEAYLKYDRGGKISWWASYALASFNDDIKSLVFRDSVYTQGFTTHPNIYDQRHTFYLDLNYRPSPNWHVNLAYQYHSGLPYIDLEEFLETPPEGGIRIGRDFSVYNRDNYDPYSRVDLRINRKFHLGSGLLTMYLQVINLFNYRNLRTIEFHDYTNSSGQTVIYTEKEYWFPRLPSLGLSWEWDHR